LSLLHDIGKIGITDSILLKPDSLTEEEWVEMKKHPVIGYRIASASPDLQQISSYILRHHERYDGGGYPDGLKGEEIPLLARIISIADAYDAMTSDRPYRQGMPKTRAINELKKNAGSQFDPNLVNIFLEAIEDKEGHI
jgi:HD-GYP domain-containing protein (c-di-GMP phosphodiesterase class II)